MPTTFADELAVWGPDARRSATLDEALTYCQRLATSHYENFVVASCLLPRRLRQHFFNVYAYCRWADDLGDEIGDARRSLELLAWWRGELQRCYSGDATHPVFVALGRTIREFDIPIAPFEDLLSAFEQDQTVREYETFGHLRDYCRRSADPVGRLVLRLLRRYDERNVAWSDSICTGLQLANFWQDVARDFDIGRVYLPREDRERFGYTDDDLRRRITNDAFAELMQFEVARTRDWLRPWKAGGRSFRDELSFKLEVEIELFARGGLRILDRIEAIDYRVWTTRPVVTKWDAVQLFIGCLWRTCRRRLTARRQVARSSLPQSGARGENKA
jgi:squalene synthase HpnC